MVLNRPKLTTIFVRICMIVLIVLSSSDIYAISFVAARYFEAARYPQSIAVVDLNGDGIQDFVLADADQNTANVLLGNEDGTYSTLHKYMTHTDPEFVTVGDLNGDGKTDMIVVNMGSNDISILLGNGDGTFNAAEFYGVGSTPGFAVLGDFNGDGKQDIAVTNIYGNNVSILMGAGDGTFQAGNNYAVGRQPYSVAVGDFNGDGKLDLAVANYLDDTISVLLGNGDGTFQTAHNYSTGSAAYSPRSIIIGDFNGDGTEDLVTANYNGGGKNISVWLGNGDGTFQSAATYNAGFGVLTSVISGDFNGDGISDLAANREYSIAILLGNGDGTFQAAIMCEAGINIRAIATADFNHDGRADIAGADGNGRALIVLGNGDGTFQVAPNYGVGNGPRSVAMGNFNGDGIADLATVNNNGWNMSLLLGKSDGTFEPAISYWIGEASFSVMAGDVDRDGKADLVLTKVSTNKVSILLGRGDGSFQSAVDYGTGTNPYSVAMGDFNGDGKTDLVTANYGSGTVSVLLNNGDGTFQPAVPYGAGTNPFFVGVGDFNGDGKADIAVANYKSSDVSILLGNGDGTFQVAVNYNAAVEPRSLAIGDFNADGKEDIAVANGYSIAILLGSGNGTFADAVHYWAGYGPQSVITGDFNGDGKIDLAITDSTSSAMSILVGNGDGTFQAPLYFGTRITPYAIISGDFNGDGKADVAVTNVSSGDVSVFLNNMVKISIAAISHGSVVCDPMMVDIGGSSSCTIYADSGYSIQGAAGCDGSLSGNIYTTGVIKADCTVMANIEPLGADTTPDPFAFSDQTNVAVNASITSNSIPIIGINAAVLVTITGGQYEINGSGIWTSAAGIVVSGNTVRVRQTSSASPSTTTNTILTIGGVSDTFSVTTQPPDTTPDPFVFTDQTSVAVNTLITSNSITVAGINTATPVTITGGQYEINGSGIWTSAAGTVVNGNTVRVRQTSSASPSTTTNTILTIGGVSDTFSVTTQPPDTTPDPFVFTDQTSVAVNTLITSNSITVAGINTATPVTITGGQYEINGSGTWTSATGTVVNGNTVRVRQTSSASYGTRSDAILAIGSVSDTFSVTTQSFDAMPDPLAFIDQTNIPLATLVTSNSITVKGINAPASVAISGGEYEINGNGIWSSASGTVTNGNAIRVRQTSSMYYRTKRNTVLTIGGITGNFSVTTLSDIDATLTASLTSPQFPGMPITATANGIGGSGYYEYRFKLSILGSWTTVQDYTTANYWTWDTTEYQSGDYILGVEVRLVGDTAEYPLERTIQYRLFRGGDIYTVAGGIGDGGQAVSAKLVNPYGGIAKDSLGNIYIADTGGHRIRKVDAIKGLISTIAGNGVAGYSGDNGPAVLAALYSPTGVAIDQIGNIYFSETNNHRIRKINITTGVITTIAGTGTAGYSGDNGQAASARLNNPSGIAIDSADYLYVADTNNHRIRKIDVSTGIISTAAGNGTFGFSGDNSAAISASLAYPGGVAFDPSGNLFIADSNNGRIRRVDAATGLITTVAGNGTLGYSGDNGAAVLAALYVPQGITVDKSGNIYIADTINNRVRKITVATGIITTIAGSGSSGYSGDNGPAISATLYWPRGVLVDTAGNILIVDTSNGRVRKVDGATGVISSFAGVGGTYAGDNGPADTALITAGSVAVDSAGNIIVADTSNNRIRKVDAMTGVITTVAGDGTSGYSGDNGPAVTAKLSTPRGVAIDSAGNIYIADTNNNRIRKVSAASGVITTVAGNGNSGYYGHNIAATSAWLSVPFGVTLDSSGNIYIADTYNGRVRKVDAMTGLITTVAGSFNFPSGVGVDGSGNIYVADSWNYRIQKVDAVTQIITSVAGNGTAGYSGDDGAAISASINNQFGGVTVNAGGDIYIADTNNHRIRKVDATSGIITTIAGNGTLGYTGDFVPATATRLNSPGNIALDNRGGIFIADSSNNRIRKIVAIDASPDTFSFAAQAGVAMNTQVISNTVTVTGINSAAAISIAGGEYELNSRGIWTSATGTVHNGSSVRVRQVSSPASSTTTNAVLTIGSVSGTFSVTTFALGDTDGSGSIDISDALKAFHHYLGLTTLTATEKARCDVAPLGPDGKPQPDSTVDIGDVITILRKIVGLVNW